VVVPYISSNAFDGDDHQLALYFELRVSVCEFELLLPLPSIRTRFVITVFKLRCICDVNFYVICDGDR
jgi:hypothetical protein